MEHYTRFRFPGTLLQALMDELVLLGLVPHHDLRRRDVSNNLSPFRKFLNIPTCCLMKGRLPHSRRCKVIFPHVVESDTRPVGVGLALAKSRKKVSTG